MARAGKMVDDQMGRTRIADLSCSTWSTVHSLFPLRPRRSGAAAEAALLLGESVSSLVAQTMHALFKNLNVQRESQISETSMTHRFFST